jgi:acetyltransferase-like isoleucine patch superfamily enzyme
MTSVQAMRLKAKAVVDRRVDAARAEEVIEIDPGTATLFFRFKMKFNRMWRRWRWKNRLANLGLSSEIVPPVWIEGAESVSIGQDVQIWRFARIEALNAKRGSIRIAIGDETVMQPYLHIGAIKSVRIGRGCLFASHVYITDHDHDFSNPMDPVISNNRAVASPVEIGDYVWLGERVMVLKGVTIGERSVIGAGSIVTQDVPPFSIAVGSPARVVRQWNDGAQQWVKVEPT